MYEINIIYNGTDNDTGNEIDNDTGNDIDNGTDNDTDNDTVNEIDTDTDNDTDNGTDNDTDNGTYCGKKIQKQKCVYVYDRYAGGLRRHKSETHVL